MRKPSSMLVGGKRFDILPPRAKARVTTLPPAERRALHLGPTAQAELEALARVDGLTLNGALAKVVHYCYQQQLERAREGQLSAYAADRSAAAENLAVLKGARKNTARNLRDR